MTSRAALPSPEAVTPKPSADYPEYRLGVLFGVASYGMWGLFPLYWPLLKPAGALEILAHRMVWSLLFVVAVLWVVGRRHEPTTHRAQQDLCECRPRRAKRGRVLRRGTGWAGLRAVLTDRRRLGLLSIAAVLITVNWGAYIWGVTSGNVVETALGYFIGPLASVVIGVLVLGERLRRWQWVAVGLGAAAVVVLTIGYGRPPWIAFLLAFPFAVYGLVKKLAATGAVESLAVETGLTAVPAMIFLGVLEGTGPGTFTEHGVGHVLLLAGGGVVTALPLLTFGAAATRIPLSMIGLLQYLAPVMQFLFGVLYFHEQMPVERWIGFTMVWLGLVVLSWDGARARRPRVST